MAQLNYKEEKCILAILKFPQFSKTSLTLFIFSLTFLYFARSEYLYEKAS